MHRVPHDKPPRERCRPCQHRLPAGTCGQPVAAGLAEVFEVVLPPAGHQCPAFTPKDKKQ